MLSGNKFKRIISIITASALALAAIPAGSLTHHAEAAVEESFTFSLTGQGTEQDPYLIEDQDDLENMRDAINSDTDGKYSKAHYKLNQDIVLTEGTVWYPIGRNSSGYYSTSSSSDSSKTISFKGVFDGNGHKISGLKIKSDSKFGEGRLYTFGLFGKNDGTIKNLSVEGDVSILAFYVGLICGMNDGTIENCSAVGSVYGTFLVGGIAGICDKTIKNCYADVKSSNSFGAITGLVGTAGKVENCYFNKSNTSIAILSGTSDTVYGLTADELKSGKAAWGLQNGQENKETVIWSQEFKKDEVPVLGSEHRVFKVTYMLDDIIVAEAYANSGDQLTAPTVEYADKGYSSGDRWFKDKDRKTENEWKFDTDTVTEDTVLYSERQAIKYTITLKTDGGTLPESEQWTKGEDNVYTGAYYVTSNDITLPAPTKEGYNFVGWTSSQEDDSTGEASATITIPQGSTGDRTYEAVYLDATAPKITITLGEHKWSALHKDPIFDLYFNGPQDITVTAEDDNVEDELTIYYYISKEVISEEKLKTLTGWTEYSEKIELKNPQKSIIYVKVTDKAGNSSYANTTGITIDIDNPVISGVAENGEYCADAEFSVTDNGAIAKITVNDVTLYDSSVQGDPGIEEGPSIVSVVEPASVSQLQPSYKIENNTGTPENYVITVTDKAGNTATRTVTLNGGHTVWYRITEQITHPTCTEPGLEYVFTCCKKCNSRYQQETRPIEPLGHSWKAWETVDSPDCDDSGSQKRTCSRCGLTETQNLNPNGHDWEDHPTIDAAPTCTSEGSQSVHCKNCDQTKDQEVIPAKEHNFGEPTNEIENPATCTSDGNTIHCYVCKDCGTVLEEPEVVPALGHTYGGWEELSSGVMQRKCSVCGHFDTKDSTESDHKWNSDWTIIKEPTCTTNGSKSILCSVCGTAKVSEDIPATGHNHDEAIKENEKLATCTESGSYDEVIYCKNCREELHRVSFEVSPAGHTWGEWETIASPDCDDSGTQQHSCTVCGVTETRGLEANGHTWEDHATVDVEPSCTTEGSKSVHCVNCSVTKDSEVIPALGHDWSEWTVIKMSDCDDEGTEQRICKVCSATETRGLLASGHKWNEEYTIDKAPDCTTDGSKSIHCVNCDATKDSEVIPALGHDWGEWETIDSPDCDDEGTQQRICKVCGVTETKGLEANGHTWEDHATVDVAPTCTAEGSQSIHCVNCSATKDSEVIPALGHDWGEWETIDSPDCDDEGTQQRTCKVCGVTETKGLEANGHTWEDHATVDVAPTCTTEGSQSIHCVNCSATKDSEVIPALGHDWGEWETIESPDCGDEGTQQRTCKVCGVTETKGLEANGHTWEDHATVDIAPTCTTEGSQSIHCVNCSATKDSEVIPALGHDWGEWETIDSPDCDDEGTQQRTCKVCGVTETKGLEANGHTWEDHATVDVEPTCTTEGSQSIHCVNCSATKDSEVIPALGHDWGEWETIDSPDCDDEGTQQRTCKVCGVTETKGLEANGHTWEDHATVDVEPTCTTEGSQSIHCVNCSATKDSEVIPALGHDWNEWETVESPDCDDEGTQQRTCKVCGVTETKGLEANGHTWEDHATVDVEPTCTTEGSQSIHCVNCSATKDSEVIPALGHDWGEWETIESPDCDDEGTQQRTCKVCGVTETKGLEANGHTWEDHATVDVEPTCTTEGSQSIHCVNCSATKDSEVIPALGHDWGEWETIESPDCDDEGTQQRTCKVCGVTETKGLAANGHTWEDHATVDVEPTCTTEGSQSIHCVNCSATKDSEVIPALGHDWGEWETIDSPDCDDEGTQQRTCKVCGVTETKGLEANGHDWEDHYTVDKEMTCLTDGSESIHCKNCDAVKDSRAIPAPGHHTPSSELVGEKPATPTEDGYTGDIVCEVCGETLEKGEVIPATQGDLEFVPETDENAPSVEMTDEEIKDLEDAVLTDEDKAARDEGADIKVVLSVKDGTDSVSDSDKQLAEELIGEDYVLGQYLEIDITKYIDSTATIVTQLSKAVKITLAIPEDLLGGKTYAVVRVHDGKAEILADIDDDPATITFLTDKFSAYAVVYVKDEIATPPDDTTKPDDTTDNDVPPATGSTLPVIPFVVTALAVTVLGISKKNRK